MRNFNELYDVEGLREELPAIVGEIENMMQGETLMHGEGFIIDTISPGWRGTYQPEDIVDVFDLDVDPDWAWVWEAIDEAEWKLTEQAQDAMNGALPDHFGIGFGSSEYDGDYGLMLWYLED